MLFSFLFVILFFLFFFFRFHLSVSNGIAEFAGLEFAGLENDGVEQEETYILHTMKWTQTNVYDTVDTSLFHAQIQIYILRVIFGGLGATMWSTA